MTDTLLTKNHQDQQECADVRHSIDTGLVLLLAPLTVNGDFTFPLALMAKAGCAG